jgi:RHS repeat-associated protein
MNPRRCHPRNYLGVKAFPQSIRTTSPATNVTVNTSNAVIYADVAFASTNQPWVGGDNTYTAIAKDAYGRRDTNSVTVNLQPTNSYTYDLNGNLLSDGRRGFDYDDENQLIWVTVTNGWKSEFTYDGKRRRRMVKEFTWNGSWVQTNEVHFIYDGNLVVQERAANNLPLVTYTRGTDLSGTLQGAGGIGGLLARTDNSTLNLQLATSYYHADGNGNVTCLIYPSQMIAAKYLYDPYGNMLSMYGLLADANTYRFSSKEWNANSGLYYYLYRLYDSNLQRWLNRDPLMDAASMVYDQVAKHISYALFLKENPQSDEYLFVDNNPIMGIDLFGLQSWMGPGYGAFGPGGVNGSGGNGQGSGGSGCPNNCGNNYANAQAKIKQDYLNCLFAGWGITGGLHLGSGTRLSPTSLLGAPAACGAKAAIAQAQAIGTYLGCLSGSQ